MTDHFTALVQNLLEDIDQATVKMAWLKKTAAGDFASFSQAKGAMLELAAKAAAVAADAASLSARLEDADDRLEVRRRSNGAIAPKQYRKQ
jgi:hypothetical protein